MSLEDDLEVALISVYEQTGREVEYWANYFRRDIKRKGAVATAKQLLQDDPRARESKGFQALVHAGRLDLSVEAVVLQPRFRRLFTSAEIREASRRLQWTGPRGISDIAEELNQRAIGRPIGDLQELRRRFHGKRRAPTQRLFDGRSIFEQDRYAYHTGGRTELQFNIGVEIVGELEYFRYGVAFSLETGRNLPTIDPLLRKIERFNEFMRVQGKSLLDLRMWHYEEDRSDEYAPEPIPANLIVPGNFIFLGRLDPAANIDIASVLDTFDRLLPLYEFCENQASFPSISRTGSGFTFIAGHRARASTTTSSRSQRWIDIQLRQNDIQAALFAHLVGIHGAAAVGEELETGNGTRIDLAVRAGNRYWFYEIKTGMSARACIREALGQLIEYAFWPGSEEAERLVVVAEPPLDSEAESFLKTLRERFGLPIFYQQFDMISKTLAANA